MACQFTSIKPGISMRPPPSTVMASATLSILVPVFQKIAAHDRTLFAKRWDLEQAIWSVLLNRFDRVLELNGLAPGYHGGAWNRYPDLARRAVYTHFVGSDRFRNFSYPRLGWRVIRELRHEGWVKSRRSANLA